MLKMKILSTDKGRGKSPVQVLQTEWSYLQRHFQLHTFIYVSTVNLPTPHVQPRKYSQPQADLSKKWSNLRDDRFSWNLATFLLLGETERQDFQFPKSVMVTWWAPELVGLEATPVPLSVTLEKKCVFYRNYCLQCNVKGRRQSTHLVLLV
jgi:hypothetical protein